MTQIIETLFSAMESTVQSEAEAKAMAEVDAIVQSRLNDQDLYRIWTAASEMQRTNQLDSFSQGFRLGMQLTLEGLGEVRSGE